MLNTTRSPVTLTMERKKQGVVKMVKEKKRVVKKAASAPKAAKSDSPKR